MVVWKIRSLMIAYGCYGHTMARLFVSLMLWTIIVNLKSATADHLTEKTLAAAV